MGIIVNKTRHEVTGEMADFSAVLKGTEIEAVKEMTVLVVGGGGREHAIVKAIKGSGRLQKLVCAPGNGGMGSDCEVEASVSADDVDAVFNYAVNNGFNFVIVGPEAPLSMGLADRLRAAGVAVYGPGKDGAVLEASKAYSKSFMKKYSIPTAQGSEARVASRLKEIREWTSSMIDSVRGSR